MTFSTKVLPSMWLSKDTVCSFLFLKALESPFIFFVLADTETGPGVLETALAYTTALRMADNATLFKYTAKSVGMTHGIIPSFMAKPWGGVSVFTIQKSFTKYFLPSFLDAAGAAFFPFFAIFIDQKAQKSCPRLPQKQRRAEYLFRVRSRTADRTS
jgi:hypothetical protein